MTQIGAFPAGLVAGQPENVADVVTGLTQIKTVVNSNLDADNLSASNGIVNTYKQVVALSPFLNVVTTANSVYVLNPTAPQATGGSGASQGIFYLDPTDYTAGSKLNKYRLKVALATNATAPLSTFTFGLYPVSSVAGGANVVNPTLGAVTAGSTVAFAAQAASTLGQGNSGDFTAPAAGYYVLGMAVTVANQAANSAAQAGVILQQRAV